MNNIQFQEAKKNHTATSKISKVDNWIQSKYRIALIWFLGIFAGHKKKSSGSDHKEFEIEFIDLNKNKENSDKSINFFEDVKYDIPNEKDDFPIEKDDKISNFSIINEQKSHIEGLL